MNPSVDTLPKSLRPSRSASLLEFASLPACESAAAGVTSALARADPAAIVPGTVAWVGSPRSPLTTPSTAVASEAPCSLTFVDCC